MEEHLKCVKACWEIENCKAENAVFDIRDGKLDVMLLVVDGCSVSAGKDVTSV